MFEFLNTDMFPFDESTVEEEETITAVEESDEMTEEEDTMMESYEEIPCEEDSIDEAMVRINLETVENYHRIIEAVMIDEFNEYVATKEEVVYEEARIKKVTDAIKKFIETAWQKIKGVYNKMMQTLDKMLNDDSKFIEKYENKIKSASPVKMKGYKYDLSGGASVYSTITREFAKNIGNVKKYLTFEGGVSKEGNLDALKSATEGFDKTLKSTITGSDASEDKFNKALRRKFCGSDEQVEITVSPSDAIDALKTNKKQKDAATAGYKQVKKIFNNLIKSTNAIEKDATKATSRKDVKNNNIASVVGLYNTTCKKTITIAGQVYRIHYGAIAASRRQAKAAARKMAGVKSEGGAPAPANESALDAIQFI